MYAQIGEKITLREDVTELLAQAERLEKKIGDNPANVLFSDSWERERSYVEMVLEWRSQADDFIHSLAGHKNETVDSLRKKTVSDLMSFAERLNTNDDG